MIEVEHVSKSFGPIPAVSDVSFHVDKGEILGFLGPNGAGKTTTMRILTGFYPASRGRARVAGLDVFEESLETRKKIGYLPENVPLYTEMTVTEYLGFAAEIKGVPSKDRSRAVDAAIDVCRLGDMRRRFIGSLSKGYRQRTGLAQALIGDPEVLILDEPTIGLDPKQIREIRSLISGMAGERTVILSTHILPEVSMTCNRVVIINRGRVAAEDTPENLSRQLAGAARVRMRVAGPPQDVRAALESSDGVRAAVHEEDDVFTVEADPEARPALAAEVVGRGWHLHEMTPLTVSLEDVFLNLVTTEEEAAA